MGPEKSDGVSSPCSKMLLISLEKKGTIIMLQITLMKDPLLHIV